MPSFSSMILIALPMKTNLNVAPYYCNDKRHDIVTNTGNQKQKHCRVEDYLLT